MKLTFLGTSAGSPSLNRNVSSTALHLSSRKNSVWLFDCGEGTLRQMGKAKLNPNKIEAVFITHLHGDHLFGLPSLLLNLSMLNYIKKLFVYGPKGIKNYIEICLSTTQNELRYTLNIIEIEEGIVYQDEHFCVHAVALAHRVPCFGYRIEEHGQTQSLDMNKIEQDRIPKGEILGLLKKGKTVTLPDGRTLSGNDYLSVKQDDSIIAIFGDTKPTEGELILAQNADIIVHEATVEASLSDWAISLEHSTTVHTATMAQKAGAKKLILTHISPRYNKQGEQKLLDECRSIFPESYIAHDFDVFTLNDIKREI